MFIYAKPVIPNGNAKLAFKVMDLILIVLNKNVNLAQMFCVYFVVMIIKSA